MQRYGKNADYMDYKEKNSIKSLKSLFKAKKITNFAAVFV